jgi:hypothetical protein
MAAFLMSIGLSVDFCAHIVYHFQFEHREELLVMDETGGSIIAKQVPLNGRLERVEFVLGTVAWPMLQSGLSTMLCICPLFAIQVSTTKYTGNPHLNYQRTILAKKLSIPNYWLFVEFFHKIIFRLKIKIFHMKTKN